MRATARLLLLAAVPLVAFPTLAGSSAAGSAVRPLQIAADSVRVVFWPGQQALAKRTLRAATAPLPLPGVRDGAVRVAGTIVLAPTRVAFDSLTYGAAPDWSAGVAVPSERLIVLPAFSSSRTPRGEPTAALRHELVHLALNAHLPGPIPRWFDEGYAMWASGELDERAGWQIRLALLRGEAPPLDSISLEWPGGASRARLAYLLSASAVRFLAERSGPQAFEAFFAAWRRQESFDAALRSTYGLTLTQFEREWRSMVRRRYGWLLAISQVGGFWLVITVLLLAMGAARRRRDRARLAQMELEDQMLPPPPEEEPGLDEDPREG